MICHHDQVALFNQIQESTEVVLEFPDPYFNCGYIHGFIVATIYQRVKRSG